MNANEDWIYELADLARDELGPYERGVITTGDLFGALAKALAALTDASPADRFTFDGEHLPPLSWLRDDEWIEVQCWRGEWSFRINWLAEGNRAVTVFPGDTLVRDPVSGRPKVKTAESEEA